MDPNLFHLDWELMGEVLMAIVVFSLFIERALAVVLESDLYQKYIHNKGAKVKEIFALIASIATVVFYKFDAIAIVFHSDQNHPVGYIVTGAMIAGGSKGSIKLFHDVLKLKPKKTTPN